MPKCSPEEELIDPCLCRLFDCQVAAQKDGHVCREQVVKLRMADLITSEQGLVLIKDCTAIETIREQICINAFQRCSGKDETDAPVGSPLTPEEKKEVLRIFQQTVTTVARVEAVADVMENFGPRRSAPGAVVRIAGKAVGTAISGFGRITQVVKEIADDPPDPNFGVIASAKIPKIPPITADRNLGEAIPAANKLIAEIASAAGFSRAMATAINRSQGAELAGDKDAQLRQLDAARGFAKEWASAISRIVDARSALLGFFAKLGVSEFKAPLLDVIELRHRIIDSGWPATVLDRLSQFGLKGAERAVFLDLLTVELRDVVALTAPVKDLFVDGSFKFQEKKLRKFLLGFAG